MAKPNTIEDILHRIVRDPVSGCWLWTGGRHGRDSGYGQVGYCGATKYVHRLVYEHVKGPIPKGKELHHKETCPKNCCNPEHLTPVTRAEHRKLDGNPALQAAYEKKRDIAHCPQGHNYSVNNTYVDRNGKRSCKMCARVRSRARGRRIRRASECRISSRAYPLKEAIV